MSSPLPIRRRGKTVVASGPEPTRCQVCDTFPSWQASLEDRRRLCEAHWREARAKVLA